MNKEKKQIKTIIHFSEDKENQEKFEKIYSNFIIDTIKEILKIKT